MPFLFPNIADLMNFSLEELVRKFKVSPEELRELADKIEGKNPEEDKKRKERTFNEYYERIMNSKQRKNKE